MSFPHNTAKDNDDYRSTISDPQETPMAKRKRNPVNSPKNIKYDEASWDNKALEFSLVKGLTDASGFPIDNDDYFGYLGTLGFYDAERYPFHWPLKHDTNTTTAVRFNDMAYQKTPLDTVEDSEPNLSRVALDNKEANLWNIQDFSETSARRILEKTHRIQNDPDRKIQAQKLVNMQKEKGRLLDPRLTKHPLQRLLSYEEMVLDTNIMLLNRLTDALDYLEKQYIFSKYEVRPKGLQFYCELTLQSGAPATKINFQDDQYNLNVPPSTVMHRYPYHNLLSLEIMIISGTNVYYATNEPNSQLDTYIKFDNAVTPAPTAINFTPGQFTIESLNIRADGGTPAVVRLIGLY